MINIIYRLNEKTDEPWINKCRAENPELSLNISLGKKQYEDK